ncbi:putative membrane protein YfcA [Pseudorhizobium tarimense]|uniref:Probable membrane transporter protein n=1 Tax=Pseudorhizobium tarimense TaxID=1079109 RepID=A0ABV2HDH8_9HYPH|nr:sulfite exporter TauE/SafE family protein [Pseudorhizobium tarimense]MCJ8521610.1 sulfite exporter TauE/SafE family protein [Pseudorhizobium tarimense]
MFDFSSFLLLIATFLVAGTVKGVTGMGLPTVAMAILGAVLSPLTAASLLLVPSLLTNLWQCLHGPALGRLISRLWPMMVMIVLATVIGTAWLSSGETRFTTAALGTALMAYSCYALFSAQLRVPARFESWMTPLAGAATGLITGGTGVLVIPAVPYLQSLGLDKDDLVQALGLSFTVSTAALAAGLAVHGSLQLEEFALSTLAVIPALAGMWLGQILRNRISAANFRRGFSVSLMLVGLEMILRPFM